MALDRSPRQHEYAYTEGLPSGVRMKDFQKGQIIHNAGTLAPSLTVLLRGRALLYNNTPDGQRVVVGLFNPVSLLGEELARGEGYKHPVTAEAMEPTKVVTIEGAVLPQVFASHTEIVRDVFDGVSRDTSYFVRRMQTRSKPLAASRIADVLLDISRDGSDPLVRKPYTQDLIGEMSILERATVNLTIAQWRKLGILEGDMKGTVLTPLGIHALRFIGEGMNDYQAAREAAKSAVTNIRNPKIEEHWRAVFTQT